MFIYTSNDQIYQIGMMLADTSRGLFHLDLAFSTRELRDICERQACALNKLGSKISKVLHDRLADFIAAKSPADIIVGSPRKVRNSNGEYLTVDLINGYQIRIVPNHRKNPIDQSGAINWSHVSRIKIVGIKQYDD